MGGITSTINKVKYIGIASLTIAILSILILNIISSYSPSNTLSNAKSVGSSSVSTMADTGLNSDSSISISITSSSPTGGNDANLSLTIPQGGGIATGRHIVHLDVGSDIGRYQILLNSKTEETSLVNENDDSQVIPSIKQYYSDIYGIEGLENTLSTISQDNAWAYSVNPWSYDNNGPSTVRGYVSSLPPASDGDVIYGGEGIDKTGAQNVEVYYGAKVSNLLTVPAGNYAASVVYSATAELQEPILTSFTPTTYELGSGEDNTLTITGRYLSSANKVYLMDTSTGEANYCTDITLVSNDANGNTVLTCKIPTDQTDPAVIEPNGDFELFVETDGGYTSLAGFKYIQPSVCRNADPDSDCQVNIDDNMIPVVYDGYDGNGGGSWRIVTKEEIENDEGSWYDYSEKKWANAITLRDDYEGGCFALLGEGSSSEEKIGYFSSSPQCEISARGQSADVRAPEIISGTIYTPLGLAKAWSNGELPDGVDASQLNEILFSSDVSDGTSATEVILGYWVYIPRYAYQVMRRDATDKVVTDEEAIAMGGFDIKFETNKDTKKVPVACNSSNSNQYYQDCPGVSNAYGNATGTSWATHPAFTWRYTQAINGFDKTYELNGFWIGKFETTGSASQPTVLPNQKHMSQGSGNIGDMYDVAKSMGVEDPNNKYGNTASTNQSNQNNNNLAISTSHMLKNSEWGAVAYLASSKYGAGINNVQLNNSYGSGGTGKGPSGRAYNTADGQKASTTNNIYGVYDMAGGAWEYVMGGHTTNASQSMTNKHLSFAVKPPYVDLYVNPPFSGHDRSNNNLCTWATCGGHALHETKNVQSVSSGSQSWGGDNSYFVYSSDPWFGRGGRASYGSGAGLFSSDGSNGYTVNDYGFRVALLL